MSAIEQVQKAFSAVQALADERDAAIRERQEAHRARALAEQERDAAQRRETAGAGRLQAIAVELARMRGERDTAKGLLSVAQAANQNVERERLEVRNALWARPDESAVAAALRVVRERDERESVDDVTTIRELLCATNTEKVVDAVRRVVGSIDSPITQVVMTELRTTLGAGRAENVRDAARRVVGEVAAARYTVQHWDSWATQLMETHGLPPVHHGDGGVELKKAIDGLCAETANVAFADKLLQVLDDVRAALGSPSGSLTEAARQIMTEARRATDAQEEKRVARECEEYAITEMKKAQARADEWAQRCSTQVSLNTLARQINDNAHRHGWWTDQATGRHLDPVKRIPECLALIHSEVSEALEAYRESTGDRAGLAALQWLENPMTKERKPEGFASELADVVIRVLDLSAALGIDIDTAIETKHAYNKTRPMRHGGKLC